MQLDREEREGNGELVRRVNVPQRCDCLSATYGLETGHGLVDGYAIQSTSNGMTPTLTLERSRRMEYEGMYECIQNRKG